MWLDLWGWATLLLYLWTDSSLNNEKMESKLFPLLKTIFFFGNMVHIIEYNQSGPSDIWGYPLPYYPTFSLNKSNWVYLELMVPLSSKSWTLSCPRRIMSDFPPLLWSLALDPKYEIKLCICSLKIFLCISYSPLTRKWKGFPRPKSIII